MTAIDRAKMQADVVCVGFGPAMGGFLSRLSRDLMNDDGSPKLESRVMPGMPLQVLCYERANDLGFGVSGVASKARAIRESFPDLDPTSIPLASEVKSEKLLYLLDPVGASRRSTAFKLIDRGIRALRGVLPYEEQAFALPYLPPFLRKEPGLIFSIGQFNQWVGNQLMGSGLVQLWPGTPVEEPLVQEGRVTGVRLMDQGTDKQGKPVDGFMPGMEIAADLTVVGDGPVGAVGQKLDDRFGMPVGHERDEWAIGMKMVVDLPPGCALEAGTVLHTFGYPEPEIFGFFYVHPGGVASVGIFVPSWFTNPVRSTYRYLQHWMMHPYLWRYLKGGKLRSWGAKSLLESGKRGEPHLTGDGYARIGEGSGSTNVLTGSGVDEAWMSGTLLAEAVVELAQQSKPFTKANLEATYVARRRSSWLDEEARIAERARDGFQKGVLPGLIGMGLAWLSQGKLSLGRRSRKTSLSLVDYFKAKIPATEIENIRQECRDRGVSLHDALMNRSGWPEIPLDGELLVSHQDALLMGGKVQAPAEVKDHVVFLYPSICEQCESKVCIEVCSAQAILPGDAGVPAFDREKCVHCGACYWNCTGNSPEQPDKTNIAFVAGPGGLHSVEN